MIIIYDPSERQLRLVLTTIVVSLNYDHSFIVLANGITIVNYDRKNFIVQATGSILCPIIFNLVINPLLVIIEQARAFGIAFAYDTLRGTMEMDHYLFK